MIGESGDPDIAARPARWLTIHAHDGGFAAFMRGARDGVEVEVDFIITAARQTRSSSSKEA